MSYMQANQTTIDYLRDDRYTLQVVSFGWAFNKYKGRMILSAKLRVVNHAQCNGFELNKHFDLQGPQTSAIQDYEDFKECLGLKDIPCDVLDPKRWFIPEEVLAKILLKKVDALVMVKSYQDNRYHSITFQPPYNQNTASMTQSSYPVAQAAPYNPNQGMQGVPPAHVIAAQTQTQHVQVGVKHAERNSAFFNDEIPF